MSFLSPAPKLPSLLVGVTHSGEFAWFTLNEDKVTSPPSWISFLFFRP